MHFYEREWKCDYVWPGVFMVGQREEDISDCKFLTQVKQILAKIS